MATKLPCVMRLCPPTVACTPRTFSCRVAPGVMKRSCSTDVRGSVDRPGSSAAGCSAAPRRSAHPHGHQGAGGWRGPTCGAVEGGLIHEACSARSLSLPHRRAPALFWRDAKRTWARARAARARALWFYSCMQKEEKKKHQRERERETEICQLNQVAHCERYKQTEQ